jgi:hypothetical protein
MEAGREKRAGEGREARLVALWLVSIFTALLFLWGLVLHLWVGG